LELSFFGAKILHPETIEPIFKQEIPLHVLNTFDINSSGTTINKYTLKENNSIIKGSQLLTNSYLLLVNY
jgi:aspartokinase